MTLEEIGLFSDYVVYLCETDAIVTANKVNEYLDDLRGHDLEHAKAALRQVLKGRVPFGPGKIVGAVLGVLEQWRKDENAGKAKVNEYLYSPGDVYRQEQRMRNDVKPTWDALSESDRKARLDRAADELGYTWSKGRWRDGNGLPLPNTWVEKRAMLTLAGELEAV